MIVGGRIPIMGVKGLLKFIRTKVPEVVVQRSLEYYRGKRLAVDTSIYMYQYMCAHDILGGFAYQVATFMRYGITPIYIFDGCPADAKSETLQKRREIVNKNVNKRTVLQSRITVLSSQLAITQQSRGIYSGAEVEEEKLKDDIRKMKQSLNKIQQRLQHPTNSDFVKCKELFQLMGVPFICAKREAEFLCAQLFKSGVVAGCVSSDSDLLANGADLLNKLDVNSGTINQYQLDTLLSSLKINLDQLIDISILCGCDYTDGIKGIGPVNGHRLIHQHGKIEDAIPHIKKPISDTFEQEYLIAREMFHHNYDEIGAVPVSFSNSNISELEHHLRLYSRMNPDRLKYIVTQLSVTNQSLESERERESEQEQEQEQEHEHE